MVNRGEAQLGAQLMTELSKRGTIELLAIVHCYFFGYAEVAYYVLPEKFLLGCSYNIVKCFGFDPF
jgi:hypothetical protein